MNDAHFSHPHHVVGDRKPVKLGRFVIVLALAALASGYYGVATRSADHAALAKWTLDQAIPTVALTALQRDLAVKEVVLPGDVEAFITATIRAQTAGYVREWRTDIGAQVRKGDILAVIETPELDDRITQAQGELAKAKANQTLAHVTAQRWSTLRGSSAVSQQAVDEKQSDASSKDAEVAAAQANLNRLLSQKAFANITAPFDGVVTERNIDIGALVSDTAGGAPLFKVADMHAARIYVRVPESYASSLKVGMKAKLRVPEYGDLSFDASLATTSRAIDVKSRSLLVELLADNADGKLTPGSFAEVRFQLPPTGRSVRAPASALLFRNQATFVAVVDGDHRARLHKVTITRDYGADVDITSDLPDDALIVTSPPESIRDGDEVRLALDDPRHGGASATRSPQTETFQTTREQSR